MIQFQTPSAGRWVLQLTAIIRYIILTRKEFQTPSAGRWVLQQAPTTLRGGSRRGSFKPHQRGGGCCSEPRQRDAGVHPRVSNPISGEVGAAAINVNINDLITAQFQTPSAGRWVLQLPGTTAVGAVGSRSFKPHQRGSGCCSPQSINTRHTHDSVSNPISGEVGAAAPLLLGTLPHPKRVSNPISGEVGAAASWPTSTASARLPRFKPHQRGGGCCSHCRRKRSSRRPQRVSNPISGEVGAAALSCLRKCRLKTVSFKPHQRGGGCCSFV